ncbi:hypothetical protein [Methanobacterium paludis]|uniref:Uncharacterized protein n=1 Tax=Methanobacterium paludis (strain DSM 25820 / JCM 18151 / SWAN1) TaxID=868131 RepID=F6D2T8_METPW|nr:hypothetical protein [Methanobacterium paludis]AEG18667.1 hypothetical protein MSWAN_1656 [Methanobacterium paludis]
MAEISLNYYEISESYGHDYNDATILFHQKKFTFKEFQDIVMASYANVKLSEQQMEKEGNPEEALTLVEDLVKNYGFIEVKPIYNAHRELFDGKIYAKELGGNKEKVTLLFDK